MFFWDVARNFHPVLASLRFHSNEVCGKKEVVHFLFHKVLQCVAVKRARVLHVSFVILGASSVNKHNNREIANIDFKPCKSIARGQLFQDFLFAVAFYTHSSCVAACPSGH